MKLEIKMRPLTRVQILSQIRESVVQTENGEGFSAQALREKTRAKYDL